MGKTKSARTALAALAAGLLLLSRSDGAGAQERPVSEVLPPSTVTLSEDEAWDLQSRLEDIAAEPERVSEPLRQPPVRRRSPLTDPELRAERIAYHRPQPDPATARSLLPVNLRRALQTRWGGLLEWLSQHEAASDAYAGAIAFGQDDLATWRALGRMRLRSGDLEGAEAAFLVALERSYARSSAPESSEVHRDLGELYLLMKRPADAGEALEIAWNRQPDMPRTEGLLLRARHEFSPNEVPAPPHAMSRLLPETVSEQRREEWETTLHRVHEGMPQPLGDAFSALVRAVLSPMGVRVLVAALGVLAILLLISRRFRGRGDLVVRIDYPLELQGSFSVRLATSQGKWKRSPRSGRANAAKTGVATRTEHFDIGRETQFQGLRPGLYFVTIEGVLCDPEGGNLVTDPYEELTVQVENGSTARLDFLVGPKESPVDVKVVWDNRPARDATVAARGLPQSLRYARDGATRLRLRKGKHTIMAGAGDRVAECEIDIQSFQASSVCIDVGSSENLIFKGCPPAVEPYLHGDLSVAARALERDGHEVLANLLLARLHRDQGRPERAAEHFERANEPLEAAEIWLSLEQHERAAPLFEAAGDAPRAAEMHRIAGNWLSAGSVYESLSDFGCAVECYRQAGDTDKLTAALERGGEIFSAAELAIQSQDRARAIRLLQQISLDHHHYIEACALLADAYEAEGHRELAIQKIEECIDAGAPGSEAPELHSHLADLFEQEGELERSLEVLEKLRDREPTYPNVATRIETLRKKRSSQQLADSRATSGPSRAATAFLAQNRYEIIQEIGRGGMGVVFKARDTRLQRIVALKQLPENLREHPKAVALFLREAQSAARLNHANIVTVYDTDQEDGKFFITMEYLEGYPVNHILRKKGRISSKNVAQLGVQIAAGLDYAHQRGIVHRDIKSANLFFTLERTVKIMDFGLAKMMEEVRRGTTVIGGTPYYMAPEQAVGENVDHRADIYAFGVTLYELLTGNVPFSDGDVAYHHRHTPPKDPRQLVPEIPEPMARLVLHMMEKRVEARCPSAAEAGASLQRQLS
jgi:tetratricopeptide (TPR) repeat protein